jgi:trimeric autotransporter adhesin
VFVFLNQKENMQFPNSTPAEAVKQVSSAAANLEEEIIEEVITTTTTTTTTTSVSNAIASSASAVASTASSASSYLALASASQPAIQSSTIEDRTSSLLVESAQSETINPINFVQESANNGTSLLLTDSAKSVTESASSTIKDAIEQQHQQQEDKKASSSVFSSVKALAARFTTLSSPSPESESVTTSAIESATKTATATVTDYANTVSQIPQKSVTNLIESAGTDPSYNYTLPTENIVSQAKSYASALWDSGTTSSNTDYINDISQIPHTTVVEPIATDSFSSGYNYTLPTDNIVSQAKSYASALWDSSGNNSTKQASEPITNLEPTTVFVSTTKSIKEAGESAFKDMHQSSYEKPPLAPSSHSESTPASTKTSLLNTLTTGVESALKRVLPSTSSVTVREESDTTKSEYASMDNNNGLLDVSSETETRTVKAANTGIEITEDVRDEDEDDIEWHEPSSTNDHPRFESPLRLRSRFSSALRYLLGGPNDVSTTDPSSSTIESDVQSRDVAEHISAEEHSHMDKMRVCVRLHNESTVNLSVDKTKGGYMNVISSMPVLDQTGLSTVTLGSSSSVASAANTTESKAKGIYNFIP